MTRGQKIAENRLYVRKRSIFWDGWHVCEFTLPESANESLTELRIRYAREIDAAFAAGYKAGKKAKAQGANGRGG